MREQFYSSQPYLRDPRNLIRTMVSDAWRSRGLAWRLASRNLNALYRRSILGYLWLLIPPLFSAAIFVALKSEGVIADPSGDSPYVAYVLCGLLLWQCFADGLLAPLRMLKQCLAILPKLRVPGEALLMAALMDSLIQASIRIIAVALAVAFFGLTPGLSAILFLLAVGALVFVGFSFGILLAPFAILLEDLERGAALILPLWMLVSGVVVAPPQSGTIGQVLALNPVAPVLSCARECLFESTVSHCESAWVVVSGCLLLSLVSWLFYRVSLPHVIARIAR